MKFIILNLIAQLITYSLCSASMPPRAEGDTDCSTSKNVKHVGAACLSDERKDYYYSDGCKSRCIVEFESCEKTIKNLDFQFRGRDVKYFQAECQSKIDQSKKVIEAVCDKDSEIQLDNRPPHKKIEDCLNKDTNHKLNIIFYNECIQKQPPNSECISIEYSKSPPPNYNFMNSKKKTVNK